MDAIDLTEKFKKAAEYAKEISEKCDSSQLLELYAYYKQVLAGPCKAPKPMWFDVTAKQKWESWRRLKDMDCETAMEKYIKIITKVEPDWEERASEKATGSSGWAAVSSMTNTDDFIPDTEKTIFDWVKEGNVEMVVDIASTFSSPCTINILDADGMALIHWAADRGNMEILECLVENLKADINLKDADGQTALHYAASCGHLSVLKFLLQHGADPDIADIDGTLPRDIASDSEVAEILTIDILH